MNAAVRSLLLVILLAAQMFAALWLIQRQSGDEAGSATAALLNFDPAAIDRIVIDAGGASAATAVLERKGDTWRVPQWFGFRASADRVQTLLSDLAKLKGGHPVTNTAAAHRRLKLADADYERRIRLEAGGQPVAMLLLGDSPGLKRSYARVPGSDLVYEVSFAHYQAAAKAVDWSDRTALHLSADDITRLKIDGVDLKRDGEAWRLTGLVEGQQTDGDAAADLVRRVAGLNFLDVSGGADALATERGGPALTMTVTRKSGAPLVYRLWPAGGESREFVLIRDDLPYVFTLGEYNVEPLAKADRPKLTISSAPGVEAPAGGPTDPASVPPGDAAGH
ncbi:MAG: DUF4340 domain-containing protein [Chromatiales bacterium]|nr:DUF4340 domain-containing protein [Chromatiales bacterium]